MPPASLLALLGAFAALGPDDRPNLLVYILGGIFTAIFALNGLSSLALNVRRLREDGLEKRYATQEELRAVHSRVDSVITEVGKLNGTIGDKLSAIADSVGKDFREISHQLSGIQRSLGQVEGMSGRLEDLSRDIDALQRGGTKLRS